MPKSSNYKRSRDRRLARLVQDGLTDVVISRKLKVSRARVGQLVKRQGLTSGRERREAILKARRQSVMDVLAQDHHACVEEISRRTGLSPSSAARICKQIGRLAKSEAVALRRQQVAALVVEGLKPAEIAERLGSTREEVAADALAMGMGFRGPRASLRPRRSQVAQLAAQGLSVQEIALQLGKAESVIYKDMLVTGITAAQRANQAAAQAQRQAQVAKLTARGLGPDVIATKLGVGRATIIRDRQRLRLQGQG